MLTNSNDCINYPTKIIVRRLPPDITLDHFLNVVSSLPKYNYISCVQSSEDDIANFGTVYINFCNFEDVFVFCRNFNNYIFQDKQGNSYPVLVEYAPNQRIPKRRHFKRDFLLTGTIEGSNTYKNFLEELACNKETVTREYSFDLTRKPMSQNVTPLLQFLSDKRKTGKCKKKHFHRIRDNDGSVFNQNKIRSSNWRKTKFNEIYN